MRINEAWGDFLAMPGFKRYFANTSWLMAERIFRMVVAMSVGVYVVRYLGPVQFGLLSYASSFVTLFAALATLGLDSIVVRELVKNPDRRDRLLGTAFWLKAGGAILTWVAIAVAIPFAHNDTETNILIVVIAFALVFQAFNVIDFSYQAEVKSKYVVYSQLASLLVSSIAKVFFIWISAPLIWFAFVLLFEVFLRAVVLTVLYLHTNGKLWCLKWRWQEAKELLKDSWPMILSGMVISIYLRIDQVMIKEMLEVKEVGLYAAAVRLSEVWYFVPLAITSSVFPAIINAKKQSEELYYHRLQKLYDLIVWLGIAIALGTTFLSPWIIGILYGEAFSQASIVLGIYIWAGVFVGLGAVCSKWFIIENYVKKNFYRTFLGMAVNVLLNIYMIPRYGIKGAAIATLMGQLTANLLYDIFDKQAHISLKLKLRAFVPLHYAKKKWRGFP